MKIRSYGALLSLLPTFLSQTQLYASDITPSEAAIFSCERSAIIQTRNDEENDTPAFDFMYVPAYFFDEISLGAISVINDQKTLSGLHGKFVYGLCFDGPRKRTLVGESDLMLGSKGEFIARKVTLSLFHGQFNDHRKYSFTPNNFGFKIANFRYDNFIDFSAINLIPIAFLYDTRYSKTSNNTYFAVEAGVTAASKTIGLAVNGQVGTKIWGAKNSVLKYVDLAYEYDAVFLNQTRQRHNLRLATYMSNAGYDIQGLEEEEIGHFLHGATDNYIFSPVFGPALTIGTESVSTGVQNYFLMLDFSMNF